MNTIQAQYYVPSLLVRAGATLRPRGRADCPRCHSRRTVSFTPQLFHCHHEGCEFHGNKFLLARELGLLKPLPPREAKRQREARERARKAAEYLQDRIRQRVFELRERHREVLDIYFAGLRRLRRNLQDETGWTLLEHGHKELPGVRAQLAILEDSPVPQRVAFLDANPEERERLICEVVQAGGLYNDAHQFIEVAA